jgi:transposase
MFVMWTIMSYVLHEGYSYRRIEQEPITYGCATFHVPRATVSRIVKCYATYGTVARPRTKRKSRALTAVAKNLLTSYIANEVALYLDEMQEQLRIDTGIKFSISTVSRWLKDMNISNKGLSVTAIQRDDFLRAEYLDMIKHIPVERLVFIDEAHKNLASERRKRGWALRGTRARREQWAGRGTKYSVLSACTVKGFVVDACHAVEKKSVNKHTFRLWVVTHLLPCLTEDSVVVAGASFMCLVVVPL